MILRDFEGTKYNFTFVLSFTILILKYGFLSKI